MKNPVHILLVIGMLALPASAGLAQVAKAPAAPDAPLPPAAPPAKLAPPDDDVVEAGSGFVAKTQKAAKDAMNQAWAGANQRLQSVMTRLGPSASGAVVIPKDEADAKSIGESQEDMNIMAHILDKVATSPDGKSRRAMGIPVRVPFDIGGSRNLYIDGYGAIFFVNVGYPLTAPPVPSDKPEAKPEAPSEWDEARRELYQPGLEAPKGDFEFKLFESDLQAAEPYDADRVEQLQKGLVESLKNASHLRCLKSHETVTVVVNGRGPGAPKKVVVTRRSSSSSGNGNSNSNGGGGGGGFGSTGGQPNVAYVGRTSGPAPESRGNQMLLRASKSDIEAFAGGKLSYDEFRKKVTVLNY